MQVLAELGYGVDCPIGQKPAFRQQQVAKTGTSRHDFLDRLVSYLGTVRKVEYSKSFKRWCLRRYACEGKVCDLRASHETQFSELPARSEEMCDRW